MAMEPKTSIRIRFVFQKKKTILSNNTKVLSICQITHGPNVSTTPITAMGCRQCLPLSVVQLKGKHCRKPLTYCDLLTES